MTLSCACRDLKAANMLVDEDGTVLLGDFGVGVFVGEREKSTNALSNEGKRKSFVGTVSGNTVPTSWASWMCLMLICKIAVLDGTGSD